MENQKNDNPRVSSNPKTKKRLSPESGSHTVTLHRSPERRSRVLEKPDISTAFHLTVKVANSSLTRKHFRLMLDCLIYEIIVDGTDLKKYLMLEYLMSTLLGAKLHPLELSDKHERKLTLISQILMRDLRGVEFTLGNEDRYKLTDDTIRTLTENNLVMSKRTYGSRKMYWDPGKFLSIKTVSVETIIERSGNSERYSSYCKGYGESHQSAHYQKTKPSFELDGGDYRDPIAFKLEEIQSLLLLTQLEVRTKFRRREA